MISMRTAKTGLARTAFSLLPIVLYLAAPDVITAEPLTGTPGSSAQWGSGWIDLAPPVDFSKGDRLRLVVGGSAGKILVRLLHKGQSPDSSVGVLTGPIDVPKTRIVEVPLREPRAQIIQISVHGGSNPWGKFPLGGGNGPATIESAERIRQ